MRPLITIAMPVYNVEKYIERAVLSALNQTYDNLEILIIDDKGQDNSISKVNEIKRSHKNGNRVRIIDHVTNRGTGATKNSAIDNAQGDYLLFMDSDDYISNDCIDKLYNAISKTNADMAVGSFTQFSITEVKTSDHLCSESIFRGSEAYSDFYNSTSYYVQTWNKLYRLNVLRENHIYCIPSNTNEDVYFSFQLFPVIKKIVTIRDITYYYAIGDPNAATYNMRRSFIDLNRVNQYVGILSSMAEILKVNPNISMEKYFLKYKSTLIRDIACSKNTTISEKKQYLNLIPSFSYLNSLNAQKELPHAVSKYLTANPIITGRVDCIINALKHFFVYLKRQILKN